MFKYQQLIAVAMGSAKRKKNKKQKNPDQKTHDLSKSSTIPEFLGKSDGPPQYQYQKTQEPTISSPPSSDTTWDDKVTTAATIGSLYAWDNTTAHICSNDALATSIGEIGTVDVFLSQLGINWPL